jgi:two-component system, NtrC family, sensor kinase
MKYDLNSRPVMVKSKIWMILPAALVSGLAVVLLGLWHADEMRDIVGRQFNEEQLVIARNVAGLIERELGFLERELTLIGREVASDPFNPDLHQPSLQKSLNRVIRSGVHSIRVIDTVSSRVYHYMLNAPCEVIDFDRDLLPQLPDPVNIGPDGTWFSRPVINTSNITLHMAASVPGSAGGLVTFDINISWFLNPFLQDIRSGQTGYAWIISEDGFFLYHPKSEFIGKDAFNVRQEEGPRFSFRTINSIQKEKMLKGQEGTGFYESGWHRDFHGQVRKLIAYTPIRIGRDLSRQWSIAIVAPVAEIEALVRQAYNRQLLLQFLMFSVIALSVAALFISERRWARFLEAKVAARTEDLQRSEEKYRSLVESAEDYIFAVGLDGVFQSVNTFTAEFFGGRPDDYVGKPLIGMVPRPVAETVMSRVRQVFAEGKSVRDLLEFREGPRRTWINAKFMPLKNNADEIVAVLCIGRDITEHKNLESQLINAEKLASIGTLAAGVAHEINNPLGVILGFCDLLLRKAEPGSQTHEDLKTIERQGLHCKEIVENLLSFARVGKEATETSDLNRCIEDVVKVVRHTLEINNIDLQVDLTEDMPPVAGDSRQLQQVFLNLINNAVAAMPEGGSLSIRSSQDKAQRRAVVDFEDAGTGIPEESLDHIFEPFYTTKPEGEGTGLGLFVSYGIINRYGGAIRCVSRTSGSPDGPAGTVFTIMLTTVGWEDESWRAS